MFSSLNSLALALFLSSTATLTNTLLDCKTPSSLETACSLSGRSLRCQEERCCAVCPGALCPGSVYGSDIYGIESTFCRAAAHSGALRLCGSPQPIYPTFYNTRRRSQSGRERSTRNGITSQSYYHGSYPNFGLNQKPHDYNINTGMLVRNFRLKNGFAPEVTCYSPLSAGIVKLTGGPFYTGIEGRFNTDLDPVSVVGEAYRESRFDLSNTTEEDRTGTYMCSYANIENRAHLSPVGIAYRGKTRWDFFDLPPKTVRLLAGDTLRLSIQARATSLKWYQDATQRASGSVLRRTNVNCSDAGLYRVLDELYSSSYAIATQALVRVLLLNENNITACNGGVQRDGRCICPPGLYGLKCEKACTALKFGSNCEYSLGSSVLRGSVLCLPDPFGCECVPGFSGASCDKNCAADRFGLGCGSVCHCSGGASDCFPYNGRCFSGVCEDGYLGDNCQQECVGRTYGSRCSSICHCADVTKCHHVTGPSENCTCSSRWMGKFCNISFVDPVARLNITRANPGQKPSLQCSVTGTPLPNSPDVSITVDGNPLQVQVLQASPPVLRATDFPTLQAGHVMNVTCCVQTAAGTHCDKALVQPFQYPELRNLPQISEATENSIKIRFSAWDAVTDRGDGPVEKYRLCFRRAESLNGTWTLGQETSNDCQSCVVRAGNLESSTRYEFAVSVKRPGHKSWGRCAPVVAEYTKSADLSRVLLKNMLSVLMKDVDFLKKQIKQIQVRCSCCPVFNTSRSTTGPPSPPQTSYRSATSVDNFLAALNSSANTLKALTFYSTSSSQDNFNDCAAVYSNERTTNRLRGVFESVANSGSPTLCQNGWLVIQRRTDGNISFNRTFSEYKQGFGFTVADYWLGLNIIQNLTQAQTHKLRIEVYLDNQHGDLEMKFIEFASFRLATDYRFVFESSVTNFPNGLRELELQLNAPFSTFDHDLDSNSSTNCALASGGGWWLGSNCLGSNLNSARSAACSAANPVCGMLGACVKASIMGIRPVEA